MLKKCYVIKGHYQDDVILIPNCKNSMPCGIPSEVEGKIVVILQIRMNAEEFEMLKYKEVTIKRGGEVSARKSVVRITQFRIRIQKAASSIHFCVRIVRIVIKKPFLTK